jgi:regulator of replication initiation timing
MDKNLRQSSKEAKKLREEISLLQQHRICAIKENEQLILENLFMDEKLRQSRKEAKKLRDEISFLKQHLYVSSRKTHN